VAKTNEVHDICAVILAAGEGTRMRSRLAKVLHPLLGQPLVHYPVDLCLRLGAKRVLVVVGAQAATARLWISSHVKSPVRRTVATERIRVDS